MSRDADSDFDAPPPREIDFGFVVGVDHYPSFRSLRGAIADAREFHAWLCDADGGGVEPQHARLIVSQASPSSSREHEAILLPRMREAA